MANRTYRELVAAAEVDHRFYLGTVRDFTPNGHDGTLVGGAKLSNGPRGTVGVQCDRFAANDKVDITQILISANQAFSYEVVFEGAIAEGSANWCRVAQGAGALDIIWDVSNKRFRFDCGSATNTAGASALESLPHHVVFTRATDGTGTVIHNGVALVSGAIGAGAADFTRFFNSGSGSNALHGWGYSQRIWLSDELSEDEAATLYENSRVIFDPGAHKRSGVYSPVGY